MKIQVIFDVTDDPKGGGNQFLKALRKRFIGRGLYADDPDEADVFLFNSYQYISDVAVLKKRYPHKTFIHRIDGPIRLYNTLSDRRDHLTNLANRVFADGTVFQSRWSKHENYRMGLVPSPFETIIHNAVDPQIFNGEGKSPFCPVSKVRLIAVSWSSNPKKGFEAYRWLDQNLDFERYAMTFVGNHPIGFDNIRTLPPMESSRLAAELRMHDVFITAAEKDPCSNALIEALSTGLPALALRDGGHPELVKEGGLLFDKIAEVPALLEQMRQNYKGFQTAISVMHVDDVADRYVCFMQEVRDKTEPGAYAGKKLSLFSRIKIMAMLQWSRAR